MLPETLRPRVLGGYLVLPTLGALKSIRRPVERAEAIRAARTALLAQADALDILLDDTAIELRDDHKVKWDAVARRCGTSAPTIHRRVSLRRAARAAHEVVPNAA
jgi:hypothetical protein